MRSSSFVSKHPARGRWRWGYLVIAVLVCLGLFLLPAGPFVSTVSGDTVITAVYPGFDSGNITAFALNGVAGLNGNNLRLTPSSGGVYGTAWWQNKITLADNRSFSAYFTFRISDPGSGGADGIIFAIQTQSSGAGSSGGGMGYEGVTPSIAVEFDTYDNGAGAGDPDANHVGINMNGSVYSLQTANADAIGQFDLGGVYHAWVDYNGPADSLEVRLSTTTTRPGSAIITQAIDLETVFNQDVYVGFTAATGGAWSQHEILSFYFNNDYIPGGIVPTLETFISAPASVTLSATPSAVLADNVTTSTIEATARDISGTPLSGQQIQFTTTLGTINATSATTNGSGVASITLKSAVPGTATVRGTGQGGGYGETTVQSTVPEIDIQGNSVSIADGDATPSLADHTDFGSSNIVAGTVVRTFTIRNVGTSAIALTGTPRILVSGTHSADFSVTAQPSTPIAAGGTTTFQVTFDPSNIGVRTAYLSIANDDDDENPYNFSIRGTGTILPVVTTSYTPGADILVHQYDFDGNLSDTLESGIALSEFPSTDSSGFGAGGWWWTAADAPGGGLVLETDQITDPRNYALGFRIKFNETGAGYKKIISFKGPSDDGGLYFLGNNLTFYPFGLNGDITYVPDTWYDFIFSRSSDDVMKVYVVEADGTVTKVYEEDDSTDASVPVLTGDSYQFMFFMDDIATSGEWTTGGTVKSLRVWNGPLAEDQIGYALNGAATNITAASATLNGNLTSLGTASSVDASFEYGLTTGYGTAAAVQARSETGFFSANITGLAPGTTYHFRATAAGDGTGYGADYCFTTLAAEMSVDGNSVTIADGDDTPTAADHTDFGSVDIDSSSVTRTFTIRNSGTAQLGLSGDPKVSLGGAHASDFTVTAQPSSPVASGGSTTFQVRFDPSSTGVRTATISIANNDVDKNPYNYTIRGTGTKVLTVTGITASDKVYDGDTTASLNTGGAALVGVVGGDTVTLNTSSVTGSFSDNATGSGKTVTVSGLTLEGAEAGFYSVTPPAVTAAITAKSLTVTGVIAHDKYYDRTTAAVIDASGAALAGVVGTDNVTLDASSVNGTFSDALTGSGKAVSVSGLALAGTGAPNYSLTQPAVSGDIIPKALTVSGITASDKVYDGNTSATIDTSGATLVGVIGTDNVTLNGSGATGAFSDAGIGNNKTVSITGLTLAGDDAVHYTLTQPATTANIISALSAGGPSGGSLSLEPEEESEPEPEPEAEPEPEPEERTIAIVDGGSEPVATDSAGNPLAITGDLITVSDGETSLRVNIPVALGEGETLGSFTDAAGLTFENNRITIPGSSATAGGHGLLRIEDGNGDLGTFIIIETGEATGTGDRVTAPVVAIHSGAGFTGADFSAEDPALGQVASMLNLELNTLPDDARVTITTTRRPDENADSAFQLAAAGAGMGEVSIAYTINVEKTNLQNGVDIAAASVTMAAGPDWVTANGGTDAIRIIRYDPETGTQQVLETRYLGTDEAGRMLFEGISPDGLSAFALAGEKQPEPAATAVPSEIPAATATPTETPAGAPAVSGPEEDIPSLDQITGADTTLDMKAWFMLIPAVGIFALAWLIILYIRKQREQRERHTS